MEEAKLHNLTTICNSPFCEQHTSALISMCLCARKVDSAYKLDKQSFWNLRQNEIKEESANSFQNSYCSLQQEVSWSTCIPRSQEKFPNVVTARPSYRESQLSVPRSSCTCPSPRRRSAERTADPGVPAASVKGKIWYEIKMLVWHLRRCSGLNKIQSPSWSFGNLHFSFTCL